MAKKNLITNLKPPNQQPVPPQTPINEISLVKEKLWKKIKVLLVVIFPIALTCIGGIFLFANLQKGFKRQNKQNKTPQPTNSHSKITYSTPTPSPTPQPQLKEKDFSDTRGKIAFVSKGEIWTINSDGSGLQQITNDENNKFHISISPNGEKIAYAFYPKDEKKRTNQGYYVGYNSGVAIVDLDSSETKIIIPYGSIQNHYPVWSPDNKYLSVWVGNGVGSKLIEVLTGKTVLSLTGTIGNYVSPIVWVPQKDKISFIENKKLITANIDGSNRQILATGVDALRYVHEAPNIPQPPFWSPSGRYVTYYKNSNLYLMDTINHTEVLIEKGTRDELLPLNYPQAYPIGFSPNETKLYMNDYAKEKNTVVLDIKTGQMQEIAMLGQSLIMSPDKKKLVGRPSDMKQKIIIIDLVDNSQKECPGNFFYSYYLWAGGTDYVFRPNTWSPDSKGIIGHKNYDEQGLDILNIEDCSVFSLIKDKSVAEKEVVWFP